MIDKSIRQHYQNGERVDPYRKGLEIIAGKDKGTFQTTSPDKITAKSLIQPTEKMTFPSMKKDKAVPPIATLPTITPPPLDSSRYRGLLNILPKTEEGSYLDKYINRKPVRIVERAPALTQEEIWDRDDVDPEDRGTYLTSSLVGTDKPIKSSDIDNILAQLTASPKTETAATFTDKGETATSFNDTQMKDILQRDNSENKNFITTILKTANDTIENLDKTKIATGFITNKVATKLGISGGAAGGPIGMLISGIVGWLVDKVTGGKKEETPKGAISLADVDSTDKPVDKPTVEDTAAMEDIITPPPKPVVTYVSPARPHGNGGGGNGGGGGHRGGAPSHSTRDLMSKGGRVDKALGGRSRDI